MRRFLLGFLACALAAAAQPLAAQTWEDYDYENLEFRGIGLSVGWVSPSRVDDALSLALRADLGNLGPNVRILPSLVYWSSQMRRREIDRLADQIQSVCLRQFNVVQCPRLDLGTIRMSDVSLNLDAQYEWTDTPLLFIPYLGLGGGIHLLNGRGESIDGTFIEDFLDRISPGLNLLGGLRIPMTDSFELTGEARYVLASDVRHAAFSVGAIWVLSTRPTPQPTQQRRR